MSDQYACFRSSRRVESIRDSCDLDLLSERSRRFIIHLGHSVCAESAGWGLSESKLAKQFQNVGGRNDWIQKGYMKQHLTNKY